MNGLREFAEWIEEFVEHQTPQIVQVNEKDYVASKNGIQLLKEPKIETETIHTLSGLCDYITSGSLVKDGFILGETMIIIENEKEVKIVTTANANGERQTPIRAVAMTPSMFLNNYMEHERFIIMLQSCFETACDDLETMLEIVGKITDEDVRETEDDGVTQVVTIKSGITLKQFAALPNPVVLTPFRSFIEIEQVSSKFILRMQNGPKLALFEADGGAWKLETIRNIEGYLFNELRNADCNEIVIIS